MSIISQHHLLRVWYQVGILIYLWTTITDNNHTIGVLKSRITPEKPMIIGKSFKSNITNIPDKYENNKEVVSIYNDLIEFLEKRGYQNKPVKLRKAYGIKSYYELCENEKFTQRFNQDKENIKQELEPIQKRIELCEAFLWEKHKQQQH